MSRVQHSKPSRRWGWAAAALVLLALPTAAQAQGFFFLFGNPSPYEIERRLEAAGYALTGPLTMRGDVYLADVVVRGEGPERLVIDAQSGRIVERYRGRADRWREASAPPPSAWSDDPRMWNGPRPPAAIGPDAPPPDAFEPQKPEVLEAPKRRQGQAEGRRDQAEVDAEARAGRQCQQPAARRRRSASGCADPARRRRLSLRLRPLRPRRARRRAPPPRRRVPLQPHRRPRRRRSRRPRRMRRASSSRRRSAAAAAPAKSKAVNDIPVTPLD